MRARPLIALAFTAACGSSKGTGDANLGGQGGIGGTAGAQGGSGGSAGGVGAAGGAAGAPGVWMCNPKTGLAAPLPTCTSSAPCTSPAAELKVPTLATPSTRPECRTTESKRPAFDDGPPRLHTDAAGVERAACVFAPAGASASARRPLVVFLHGGGGGAASDLYDYTSLRSKAPVFDLSGDPARPGFHLVAVQGRNLHYPTGNARDGHHHDFYYRDLASPSSNPDVANLDRLVDESVAAGAVDPKRIYVTGWSNGGFFGQMYAIARHALPTPGGNRVAAAAVYTAGNPFHNINFEQVPSCELDPYPMSKAPIFLLGRSCDIVPCDAAQAADFVASGSIVEPGHEVTSWIEALATKVGDPNVTRLIVTGTGAVASACSPASVCTPTIGLVNHVRWPDGVADGSGNDYEADMLAFLRAHPLP